MHKMTLLEMVQNILSALDSDEVTSISDTVESLQVAEIIKETFYEQFNNIYVPEFNTMFPLTSVALLTSPNYLKVPTNVSKIEWIRFKDFRAGNQYRMLTYVSPEEFMERQFGYTGGSSELTLTKDPVTNIEYYVRNDGPPSCFTLMDDEYIAFDSYDLSHAAQMVGTDAVAYGSKVTEFVLDDNFVPPIDGNLFPLLLAEAKSVAFINLKQVSSSKEEQRARRQRIRMQNDQFKARFAQYDYWNRGPDYSRHR